MYILYVMRFEWDEEKALENAKKHRVSFEQAQQVFDDPRAVPFEDLEHSTTNETRYVMIGMSPLGLLFVSFTIATILSGSFRPGGRKNGW
jgi:uncharacterized DUF497 family protein